MERQRRVTTIPDILTSTRVAVDLVAPTQRDAIETVIGFLNGDPRVVDFDELREQMLKSIRCLSDEEADFGICLPHARTEAVTSMVMSAGRFRDPVPFSECARPIRYIYCIAVPGARASDYLRIVGLLARTQRTPAIAVRLAAAATPAEFVDVLAAVEQMMP